MATYAVQLTIMTSIMTVGITGIYAAARDLQITTSRGAYFNTLDLHVYEKTTPLIYSFDLPTRLDRRLLADIKLNVDKCTTDKLICENLKESTDETIAIIKDMEKVQTYIIKEFEPTRRNRRKRGLQFMGDFQHWCCNVLTDAQGKDFENREVTLKEGYKRLRDSVIDNHAALLNSTTEMQTFTIETSKKVKELKELTVSLASYLKGERASENLTEKLFRKMQSFLNNLMAQNSKLHYLIGACKNHYLPSAIVDDDKLLKDLENIKQKAKMSNLELALDNIHDIKYYHHSKLINCFVSDKTIEIEIKIPLKTQNSIFRTYEFQPLKFKDHSNQICQWNNVPMILIHNENNNQINVISGNELEFCNKKDELCYITQNRASTSHGECAKTLFLRKPHSEIIKACILKCEINHQNAIVHQIQKELFAVTNTRNPLILTNTITNKTENITIKEEWPGTTILKIPCSTEVKQINADNRLETLISVGLPCLKNTFEPKIEHHVPIVWTHFKNVDTNPGIEQSFRFNDIKELYDKDWSIKIPHFLPITSNKDFKEKFEDIDFKLKYEWYRPEYAYNTIIENPFDSTITIWIILFSILNIYALIHIVKRQVKETTARKIGKQAINDILSPPTD